LRVLVLAAAAGAAVLLGSRSRCERVLPYATSPPWQFETVKDGRIFLSLQDRTGVVVRSYPATGGPGRLVVSEPSEGDNTDRMFNFKVMSDRVYYVLGSPTSTSRDMPQDAHAHPRRARMQRLSGGAPETLLTENGGVSISFGSKFAFITVPIDDPRLMPGEVSRELWLQPLPRGPRQRVAIIPPRAIALVGSDGMSYLASEPPNQELVHLREADQELRTYPVAGAVSWLETENGLVWVRDEPAERGVRRAIMRTAYDAESPTVLAEWPVTAEGDGVALVAARGDIVFFLTARVAGDGMFSASSRISLWRSPSGSDTHPKLITALPTGAHGPGALDGDYFYFDCREARENWLDWSPAGLRTQQAASVQRVYVGGEVR